MRTHALRCVPFSTAECPICMLHFQALNTSLCCNKRICTECYLQVILFCVFEVAFWSICFLKSYRFAETAVPASSATSRWFRFVFLKSQFGLIIKFVLLCWNSRICIECYLQVILFCCFEVAFWSLFFKIVSLCWNSRACTKCYLQVILFCYFWSRILVYLIFKVVSLCWNGRACTECYLHVILFCLAVHFWYDL